MAQYRLSARVTFSPEAEKLYLEAKNKTDFILQAIEFYAKYGKTIQDDLQEIKQLLYEIRDRGNIEPGIKSAEQIVPDVKKEISDEDRELYDGIMSTLNVFLGRTGDDE